MRIVPSGAAGATGTMQVGDLLVSVNGRDPFLNKHQLAADIASRRDVELSIRRVRTASRTPTEPRPPSTVEATLELPYLETGARKLEPPSIEEATLQFTQSMAAFYQRGATYPHSDAPTPDGAARAPSAADERHAIHGTHGSRAESARGASRAENQRKAEVVRQLKAPL
jgi:hypothetical protein